MFLAWNIEPKRTRVLQSIIIL